VRFKIYVRNMSTSIATERGLRVAELAAAVRRNRRRNFHVRNLPGRIVAVGDPTSLALS
jgi:hypothetical protein